MSIQKNGAPLSPSGDTRAGGEAPSRPRGWPLLLGLVVGLVLGFAGAKFWVQDQAGQRYGLLKAQLEQALAQRQSDLDAAVARLDSVQGRLAIEEGTRKGLESTLASTQQELGRARDHLAFFDRLLPPGPNGSISLRALEVQRHGPLLEYRALLMRNAPGSEAFKGRMQFMANGEQDGKAAKIELRPAGASGPVEVTASFPAADEGPAGQADLADPLELSFDQFQRSTGVLSVPDGFVAKTITLNILEGNTVRASHTVNLPAAE